MASSESIKEMDTALAGLVVMFIQLFVDKFRDDIEADGEEFVEIQQFLDNMIYTYCDVLDDEGHAEVIFKRLDDITDTWLSLRNKLDEDEDVAD